MSIDSLKSIITGYTIVNVTEQIKPNGDIYTRLHFDDNDGMYYEFLSHFTANDHQVAIARDALLRIMHFSGNGIPAQIAKEGLERMGMTYAGT